MSRRADICFLSLNFPPEPTGIAPYVGALATRLQGGGNDVVAHVAYPHYPGWAVYKGYAGWTSNERKNGVAVTRRLHYVPRSPRGLRRALSELSFGLRTACAPWGRPRVVVAVSPALFSTAMAVLRVRLSRHRPPVVIWVQDLYALGLSETGEAKGIARTLIQWVEKTALRSADRVVVIHDRFGRYVTQELGVERRKVVTIRNWTHLPPSVPVVRRSARSTLGWPLDVTLAVHTGNMGAKQGLENIIEAARLADERAAPVHFILVGDGGERRQLEQRAEGISRVSFVAPVGDAEYRLALGAADILLVNEKPGVSAMAVPSKLTSYFDAGRPVLAATDPRGITAAEVLAAQAGLVVPAGDPEALVDAVIAVGKDKDEAERFGENGRRFRDAVLNEETAIKLWTDLLEPLKDGVM